MPIVIEHLRRTDFDVVAQLFDDYRVLLGRESTPASKEFLRRRVSTGQSTMFVAHLDGEIVGFLNCYHRFMTMELHHDWFLNDLYVRPDRRRLGVGTQLIETAIAAAKSDDADLVSVAMGDGFDGADGWIVGRGFVRGVRPESVTYSMKLTS